MAAPALRPLGIGEILDVSLKLSWRNLGTLARIVLFVVAPAQVLIAIVDVSAIPNYRPGAAFLQTSSTPAAPSNGVWTGVAAALVSLCVGFLAGQFATGACFRAITESYLGFETSWRSSLSFAARKLHSIVWIALLGLVATVIGFLFCIVPGAYLLVAFAVALPVLMSEGQRGSKALGRSRALISGRWWRTAVTLLVAFILVALLSSLITGAVTALVFTGANGPVELFAITAVSGTLGAVVTTPFTAAYHTVIYFDLRVRKEAFDLRLLASRIGVEPPPDWSPTEPGAAPASSRPPFWPPPPGWAPTATDPSAPAPTAQPPFWPPPPGWTPPRPSPPEGEESPPFWPPPPGSSPGRK